MSVPINWSRANWDLRDIDLSRQFKCSREAVRVARKRLGKPKSPLHKQSKLKILLLQKFQGQIEPITIKDAQKIVPTANYLTLKNFLQELNIYKSARLRIPVLITREQIREIKKRSGLTITKFAKAVQIPRMTLTFYLYEKNPKKKIRLNHQKRIIGLAEKLNIADRLL